VGIIKRRDLIRRLESAGYKSVRKKGPHEIFSNGFHSEAVPHGKEINEYTAKAILDRTGA